MQYALDMRGCLDWMKWYSQISYSIVKTISVIFPVAFWNIGFYFDKYNGYSERSLILSHFLVIVSQAFGAL